jgi:hypothetical protein
VLDMTVSLCGMAAKKVQYSAPPPLPSLLPCTHTTLV